MLFVLSWWSVQISTNQQAHILWCATGGEVAARNNCKLVLLAGALLSMSALC